MMMMMTTTTMMMMAVVVIVMVVVFERCRYTPPLIFLFFFFSPLFSGDCSLRFFLGAFVTRGLLLFFPFFCIVFSGGSPELPRFAGASVKGVDRNPRMSSIVHILLFAFPRTTDLESVDLDFPGDMFLAGFGDFSTGADKTTANKPTIEMKNQFISDILISIITVKDYHHHHHHHRKLNYRQRLKSKQSFALQSS